MLDLLNLVGDLAQRILGLLLANGGRNRRLLPPGSLSGLELVAKLRYLLVLLLDGIAKTADECLARIFLEQLVLLSLSDV